MTLPMFPFLNDLKGALKTLESFATRADGVQIDQALQSLREILFLPDEVRSVIESIAKGRDVDTETARSLSLYFSTIDDTMAETLRYIDPRRFDTNFKISSDSVFNLSRVGIEKRGMRDKVSKFLSEYVDAKINGASIVTLRANARALLRDIDALNKQILKTEKALLTERSKRARK